MSPALVTHLLWWSWVEFAGLGYLIKQEGFLEPRTRAHVCWAYFMEGNTE